MATGGMVAAGVMAAVLMGGAAMGQTKGKAGMPQVVSLAGEWRFALDPDAKGVKEAWFGKALADTIALPGTTETNGKGPENKARELGRLTRVRHFDGQAWYQRDIEIPATWARKRVELLLERTKYTRLWVDDRLVGSQALFCVPQEYDLSGLSPGRHRLTILVDNRAERRPLQAEAHQFSDNTQTNWNGVIGRIELRATDPVWIDDVQVYPDAANRSARVRLTIGNATGMPTVGRLALAASSWNHAGPAHQVGPVQLPLAVDAKTGTAETTLRLGQDAPLWDEFSPALYRLTVTLETPDATDEHTVEFGLRDFGQRDGQFSINGRATFLRGKHDGCVFPLTGHPPMDVDGWLKYLQVVKDYGVNQIRCHTWVPPDAALAAADRLGMYYQVELPFWGAFDAKVRDALMPEAIRVLRDYGNHPSFVMLTLGNELGGSRELMSAMVRSLRDLDSRHLYACGSNNYFWDPKLAASDDFWVTMFTHPDGGPRLPVRGSYADADGRGAVQHGPADTRSDFRAALAGTAVPVVGHEIAQYTVYPDFREIPRYTGVTRARNLEQWREKLLEKGMGDQADAFVKASGALAVLCDRADIEMAVRTPGFGGFEILDLQDFPGQGTALVGILNAFMEPKGLITPAEWRRFCGPIVPLARFDRYTWTTAETFTADVEVAHYGARDVTPAVLEWSLAAADGKPLAKGELRAPALERGGLRSLGRLEAPLVDVKAPEALTLTVQLRGTEAANSYTVWVYPAAVQTDPAAGVTVARSFDAATRDALAKGGRVVLIPEAGHLANTVDGGFATDFWCWPMFHNKPGTMGLLCDPTGPALAGFPTESHSDWQWFHLAHDAQPVILDATPQEYRPLVQVIDNLDRSHKLGLVFEAKVGDGRLLVCATDLLGQRDRPEARQLLRSLLDYAASDAFAPKHELPLDMLKAVLLSAVPVKEATASTSQGPEYAPGRAVDADPGTRWCASDATAPQWLAADLGAARIVNGCDIAWESEKAGYAYVLEGSTDREKWATLADQSDGKLQGRHLLTFPPASVRYVRVRITGLPKGQWASIYELRVLGED